MANCNYKVNLTDIQNKYKFKIFNTGSYNDSDLRKMIESVFYALPRTTGTGTSVTLNDTAFSYLKNKLYATNTSQYTTTGKNLLPNTKYEKKPLNLSSGTILTLSTKDGVESLGGNVKLYDIDNNVVWFSINAGETSKTRQLDKDVYYIENALGGTIEYQLEVGNSVTDYEEYTGGIPAPNPDYPQVIHTITGDNTIKVANKNLFNPNVATNNCSVNNGLITITSNTTDVYIQGSFIYSEANKFLTLPAGNYYIKTTNPNVRVTFYGSTYLDTIGTQPNVLSTTTNFGGIRVRSTNSSSLQNVTFGIMLSTTNDAFTPYQENSVELTLGDKEICKIGNYEDKIFKAIKGNEVYDSLASEEKTTLDYGKWYLRKEVGKLVINENLTNVSYIDTSKTNTYIIQVSQTTLNNITTSGVSYCNILNEVNWSYAYDKESYYLATNTLVFKINKSTIDSQTGANVNAKLSSYLENTNFVLMGGLKTPTNELFNDTIQEQLEDIYNNMLSYEGQTYVSQVNDDLPFNINSTAIKDLNSL